MKPSLRTLLLCLAAALPLVLGLSACQDGQDNATPLPRAAPVDLNRYMGDWYVIASIPSFIERDAYDAVESYALKPDGHIQTTFRYRHGSHEAPFDTMHPVGTVKPGTGNAVWGMEFIWPIQAEYVIAYLDEGATQTIVARSARDYVWIMARTPVIPEADYQAHVARIKAMGYDIGKLRKVPQQASPLESSTPPNGR